ncbi:hypothetical protein [Phenylobacterium sp.]|uniref:hypothetical protein n=1 Tax=Phenylobacterium sp. TaxID=1871053 RepID=UPI00286A2612|nr:hypothetical protein [Phenylobacterium sp.]
MMLLHQTSAALAASTLLLAGSAFAQPVTGGTSGGVSGRGVTASTYGAGHTDGQSIGIQGGGAAVAVDGTARTQSDAKVNERRAMQRSVASARTDDERARSRTRTVVRQGEEVRSRTMSVYKEQGEKPIRESVYSVTTPEGETVRRK